MRMTGIAIAMTASSGIALAQPSLVIDDFDVAINDELGGLREISLDVLANPFGQQTNFGVMPEFAFAGTAGALVFNSGLACEQVGTIAWGTAGGELNLNAGELAGFELGFLQVDQSFQMTVALESASGAGTATWVGAVVGSQSPQAVAISFADFATAGGFDQSDLDSITVRFNTGLSPVSSLDFVLADIEINNIPAPASVALLGLSGLVASRRRRR